MSKEIVIKIDAFGNTHLDAVGFVGSSCKEQTAAYLTALSAKEKDDTEKPEYSMPNTSGATVGSRW